MKYEYSFLKNLNWFIIGLITIISFMGIANLYSLQYTSGENIYLSQVMWFFLGSVLFMAIVFIDYRIFSAIAIPLYVVNVLLLFLVLMVGKEVNFSKRWLDLGFFMFQPSETMKLTLAFVLAKYFANYQDKDLGFKDLIIPLLLTLLPAALIKIEPDLGSAIILFAELFIVIFMVKVRAYVWLTFLLVFLISIPILSLYVLDDYHIKRFNAFLNPEAYAKTTAYQTIQATFAIGSGKMFGKGFTKGPISKGKFVPEQKTDFAFSVWAEEFGFAGSLLLILIYLALLILLTKATYHCADHFGFYSAIIIIGYISSQIIINLLMVSGLFPVVGVPLPLFSYGGTNMLTTLSSIGIIMSIYARRFFFAYPE